MTTATRTAETTNATIEITLFRKVTDKIAWLDGHELNSGREVYENYEVTITSKRNGQSIKTYGVPGDFAFFSRSAKLPEGTYARIGDGYIGQEIYETAMRMIAELDAEIAKTDEQIALENAEIERQRNRNVATAQDIAEQAERERNPGWCNKCHSYCWGDCEAN